MKFYSTRNSKQPWEFRDVIIQGLAPDGGLFMPERIVPFDSGYFKTLGNKSFAEMSFDVATQLLQGVIADDAIYEIVNHTVNFEVPVVQIDPDLYALELYHGPTLA